uniref:Uncharacterized protein n=1 Tax=Lotharella globosa TaxID=91324 RepID=A0A7S4DJN9_9EUKA
MHDWKSSRHVCRVRWLAHTKALNGPTFGVQGSLNHNLVLLLGFLRFTTFQFQVTRLYFRLLSLSSALRERSGQRKELKTNGMSVKAVSRKTGTSLTAATMVQYIPTQM